jgi:hypothetical protein
MTDEIQPSSTERRLDVIQAEVRAIREEQRLMRAEWRNQNQILMEFHRDMKRLITRLDDKIDHLEEQLVTTIKIELGGRMADIETRQEQRLDASIETQLAEVRARLEVLERR